MKTHEAPHTKEEEVFSAMVIVALILAMLTGSGTVMLIFSAIAVAVAFSLIRGRWY